MLELCALSGSLRAVSRNTALLRAAQLVAPAPIRIAIFDRLGEIPPFNPDIESIQPPAVSALKLSVAAADSALRQPIVAALDAFAAAILELRGD